MDEITVPIYLITGFLESGKTSFLSFTLQQDYFRTEGKTLLILCEEGEEEYDEEALAKDNVVIEVSHRSVFRRWILSISQSVWLWNTMECGW